MDAENKALLALTQTKGELRQAMAEVKRLEAVREIAEEAVDRLRRIGDTYSLAYCAEIEPTEALNRMEVALRGDPPEGEIRHHVLAKELAALAALPAPERDDGFCVACGAHVDDDRAHIYPWTAPDGTKACCPAHWIKKNWPPSAAPVPEGVPEDRLAEAQRITVESIRGWSWLHGSVIASSDARILLAIIDQLAPLPPSDTPHEEGAE